jgi:hypothetical protein
MGDDCFGGRSQSQKKSQAAVMTTSKVEAKKTGEAMSKGEKTSTPEMSTKWEQMNMGTLMRASVSRRDDTRGMSAVEVP